LKFLKEGKYEKENQEAIKSILSQLPPITKEMHLFVKSLDTHSQNIQKWLQIITPEITHKNLHLYRRPTNPHRRSTASSQSANSGKFSQKSKEEILHSFNHYANSILLMHSTK
jgi:hypothetical protein